MLVSQEPQRGRGNHVAAVHDTRDANTPGPNDLRESGVAHARRTERHEVSGVPAQHHRCGHACQRAAEAVAAQEEVLCVQRVQELCQAVVQ